MSQVSPSGENVRKRSGVWASIAYFAGVTALVAGIYWIAPTSSTESTPEASVAAELETTTTTSTTTPTTLPVQSPSFVPGEEPIADAAEVILPSVVHIQTSSGIGSGVIYDSDGLIVTAAHVVAGEDTVRIRFDNGEQVIGSVVGSVSDIDIAVIDAGQGGLPAADFSTGKPRVGQLAIAVGSPWGLESTVTAGIISAVDQTNCGFDNCVSMVQTDAAINPGNSGGALVDRAGEVVGINVSIFSASGANDGVGFAVPAETAMAYADSIVSGEPIETAFLGVSGDFVDEGRAGALITEVFPDTAATEAGIEVGDVVLSFDGVRVQGIDDLAAQVRSHRPGDTVELLILRDDEEIALQVTLGVRSEEIS